MSSKVADHGESNNGTKTLLDSGEHVCPLGMVTIPSTHVFTLPSDSVVDGNASSRTVNSADTATSQTVEQEQMNSDTTLNTEIQKPPSAVYHAADRSSNSSMSLPVNSFSEPRLNHKQSSPPPESATDVQSANPASRSPDRSSPPFPTPTGPARGSTTATLRESAPVRSPLLPRAGDKDSARKSGGDGVAGQEVQKNTFDLSRSGPGISIHWKKSAYDDSDDDGEATLAIKIPPPPPPPPVMLPVGDDSCGNRESGLIQDCTASEDMENTGIEPDTNSNGETEQAGGILRYSSDSCLAGKINGDSPCASIDGKVGKAATERKPRKNTPWYNMLSTTYKSRSTEFKRIFKVIPSSERLIVDYSCALQRDILAHGRLYVTRNWICFYANIFRWETAVVIPCKDIVKITKEKTALVIPNAIQICTTDERYFLTSFAGRDKSFVVLDRVRKCAVEETPMSDQELWLWVHYTYGEELGLTADDADYIALSADEKIQFQKQLQLEEKLAQQQNADSGELNKELLDVSSTLLDRDDSSVGDTQSINSCDEVSGGTSLAESPTELHSMSSIPSLDIAEEPSTDTENSAAEAPKEEKRYCANHEHFDIPSADEILDFPVDTVFQLCFTDSVVFRNFAAARKTFDVMLSPWPDVPEESGVKVRNISYTLTLNNALGPKVSPSTERQILHPESRTGEFYLVDTECINGGVPYSETFYVVNRYCISKMSKNKTRLRVTSMIKYRKSVWGFVRNLLDKNVTAGILDAFSSFAEVIRQESNKHGVAARKRPRRRPGSKPSTPAEITEPEKIPAKRAAATAAAGGGWSPFNFSSDGIGRFVIFLLLLLTLLNVVLLFKLSSDSNVAVPGRLSSHGDLHTENSVRSPEQWVASLNKAIQLLDEMAQTLADLRDQITADTEHIYSKSANS